MARRLLQTGSLLLALCLLQAGQLLPACRVLLATANLAETSCQGDHARCGCSPVRIAERSCCCMRPPLPGCCQANDSDHEIATPPVNLRNLPCGGSVDPLLVDSLGDEEFMPASASPLRVAVTPCDYQDSAPPRHPCYRTKPPTPPPRPRQTG